MAGDGKNQMLKATLKMTKVLEVMMMITMTMMMTTTMKMLITVINLKYSGYYTYWLF